jgi:hypothetical protein
LNSPWPLPVIAQTVCPRSNIARRSPVTVASTRPHYPQMDNSRPVEPRGFSTGGKLNIRERKQGKESAQRARVIWPALRLDGASVAAEVSVHSIVYPKWL